MPDDVKRAVMQLELGGVREPPACDHAAAVPAFDEEAARGLSAREVRERWPRFVGECPACGQRLIAYASLAHYVCGDW